MMQPSAADLTLDVCVLMSGSLISDPKTNVRYGQDSLNLMKRMITGDNYLLALDERQKIKTQYDTKLGSQTFGQIFLKQMASMNKISSTPWKEIDKGARVKLQQRGFSRDNEDYKYVITASSTSCRMLVSHEPHFFNVVKILQKAGIIVRLPSQC